MSSMGSGDQTPPPEDPAGPVGAAKDTPESHPMAYMTSNDPSPYLFESQVHMLGRASMGAREAVSSRRGSRRVVAMIGVTLMVLALLGILAGVLLPLVDIF